jgi:hypothetical protein
LAKAALSFHCELRENENMTFLTPTLTPGRLRAFVRLWPLLALMLLFPDRSPHAAEAKVLTGKAALGDRRPTRRACGGD